LNKGTGYWQNENAYKEDYPEVPRDGHPDGFLNLFLPIKHDGAFAIFSTKTTMTRRTTGSTTWMNTNSRTTMKM
jgi:hypothetical protein